MKLLFAILGTCLYLTVSLAENTELTDLEEHLLSMLNKEKREEDGLLIELSKLLETKKDPENNVDVYDVGDECKDRHKDCKEWVLKGACAQHKEKMRETCALSCKFCCKDNWPTPVCQNAINFGYCEREDHKARLHCAKSCGECGMRMPAPPPCITSKFGCCWDHATTRLLPAELGTSKYSGCPECKDRNTVLCERFKADCDKPKKLNGKQIRKLCPVTCGLCGPNAKAVDYADEKLCKVYKLQGICESSQEMATFFCEKTCALNKPNELKPCADSMKVDCQLLGKHNACNDAKFKDRMHKFCPVTCDVCKPQ